MEGSEEETGLWPEDGAAVGRTESLRPAPDVRPTAWADDYPPEDGPPRGGLSWKQVGLIAAAIFALLAAVATMIISSWLRRPSTVVESPRTVTVQPAAPQAPTAAPPPVTVTAPPPVTVTQAPVAAPPPVTVVAPSDDGTFIICPDGHSGVATSVTSCQFAMNVRNSYIIDGGPVVIAYSPVTGDSYRMVCHSGYTSHLSDGEIVNSVRCAGGNDAVVILW